VSAALFCGCGDDASHIALPHVIPHGGPILTELDLVTITYPNDPIADVGARFDDLVPRTRWLDSVGGEYGIHGGAHLATYLAPGPAPAHLTYDEAAAIAPALVAGGAVPGPTEHGVPILYVVYLPSTTTISDPSGGNAMCIHGLAYHTWSGSIPSAVVPDCYPGSVTARTMFASHEIIEAATDPFGTGYYVDPSDYADPLRYYQPEVADLCNRAVAPAEGGFAFEASWSNAEADAWSPQPCQPMQDGDVYTMVIADPAVVVDANRGQDVTWDLTGWASGPTDDWSLVTRHGYAGDSAAVNDELAASARFSAPTINAGQHVQVTATVPADATSGTVVAMNIWSRTTWNLVAVRVR
jgi:hypothetical protein